MMLSVFLVVAGMVLLLWSAGWFVTGAAAVSRCLGVSPLLIGMVVVGFGTSAPELAVSVFAALEGKTSLALGNATGSNITNLGLIAGMTAWICPIPVASGLVRKEMPLLAVMTVLAAGLMWDLRLTRVDGVILLAGFGVVMGWAVRMARAGVKSPGGVQRTDALGPEVSHAMAAHPLSLWRAAGMLLAGLVVLLASSRLLVAGAVDVAQRAGVGELVIGLTVVAVGTSLPELASALVAARRGEHDLVLGNVLGSNLFNTLAVTGLAVVIRPTEVEGPLFWRDMMVAGALTLALPVVALDWGAGNGGRINRVEGMLLVLAFVMYTVYLVMTAGAENPVAAG